MDTRLLIVAGAAAALVLLAIYIWAGRTPPLEAVEEECLPGNPYRYWAEGSTRSYALMYDRDSVRPGEAVHVKIWVFTPQGGETRARIRLSLGSASVEKVVEMKRSGIYLEACLAVKPSAPGTLTIEWRGMTARIKVSP